MSNMPYWPVVPLRHRMSEVPSPVRSLVTSLVALIPFTVTVATADEVPPLPSVIS
jgi:hypothetical protein